MSDPEEIVGTDGTRTTSPAHVRAAEVASALYKAFGDMVLGEADATRPCAVVITVVGADGRGATTWGADFGGPEDNRVCVQAAQQGMLSIARAAGVAVFPTLASAPPSPN
jgi:hypothetical protein